MAIIRPQVLDPVELDLQPGIQLIEASAGTGKTYTIAMLALRLLVELEIPIEQLLIVTYTKAATEELRNRIRRRLLEARDLLRAVAAGAVDKGNDPMLLHWAKRIASPQQASACLARSVAEIDLAPVFTIHGFCQRALAEHALASGQLLTTELLSDVTSIRLEVAQDFWRQRIYGLPVLAGSTIMEKFPDPASLLASVSGAVDGQRRIVPSQEDLNMLLTDLTACFHGLLDWWQQDGKQFFDFCCDGIEQGYFKKDFASGFRIWADELAACFASPATAPPPDMQWLVPSRLLTQLNGQKLRGEAKRQAYLATVSLPFALAETFLSLQQKIVLQLRVDLAWALRREVQRRLDQQGQMGFDDLIRKFSLALSGSSGQDLRNSLAKRYRIGLIDEFQDTDGAQYHIFTSIFSRQHQALYLIGDPKQAIYRFRGADINSYFLAKNESPRQLTLPANYRSHPALIAAINNLFGSRPQPFYLDEELLAYLPVAAARTGRELRLERQGESLAGLVCWQLPQSPEAHDGGWSSTTAAGLLQRRVATEIVSLLDERGAELFTGDQKRQLAPRDIAILVRSHVQAEQFRSVLAEANVQAVVTGSISVLQTEECGELICLLQALLQPRQAQFLRGALALRWFGLSGDDFHLLAKDLDLLGRYTLRFLEYSRIWREEGLLVMMERLLAEERVYEHLAGLPGAERTIVNLNHLLSLAQDKQEEANLQPGEVIQWLLEKRREANRMEHELLLESDEDAVQIVTMHGAKGLEYPVVFCPYSWYATQHTATETLQVSCFAEGEQLVDLGSQQFAQHRALAAREEKSEELRLLYVAVTRAKLRCYLMWAEVRETRRVASSFASAFGYLLFPDGPCDYQVQQQKLRNLSHATGGSYVELSLDEQFACRPRTEAKATFAARPPLTRSLAVAWQISSFSALANLSEEEPLVLPDEDCGVEKIAVAALPAGPQFGNLIHDLLEQHDFASLLTAKKKLPLDQLSRRYGSPVDAEEIRRFLQHIVATPLVAAGRAPGVPSFCLADLDPGECVKEMAFFLRSSPIDAARVNSVLAHELSVSPLSYFAMEGFFTGFIDLFFRHEDRFYLLDYKTNYLGELQHNYGKEQLLAAMQSHNYGLQYWLYTLAVHRHLRNVVADYDYERDFGGVFYLFLRGMQREQPGSGVFWCKPAPAVLTQLDLLFAGESHE